MVTPLYFQPVRALAAAYHERADALGAVEALALLLDADATPMVRGARTLLGPPSVEVADLSVVFPDRERPALDDVSLTVEPGELIGVTGASGAGKSTLLRVLAGDLEPSGGTVQLDGEPPTGLERSAITWLGQRPYLFPGTLAGNVALGRPDAYELQVLHAALAAGLGDVLDRVPGGVDTPVGEGGWGLSGGEAHRVALARTFLKRAPLLLGRADRAPRRRQRVRDHRDPLPARPVRDDGRGEPLAGAARRLRSRDHARPPAPRPAGGSPSQRR